MNTSSLTTLIKQAAAAHHDYEQTLAVKPDPEWAAWYAQFMTEKLGPQPLWMQFEGGRLGFGFESMEAAVAFSRAVNKNEVHHWTFRKHGGHAIAETDYLVIDPLPSLI